MLMTLIKNEFYKQKRSLLLLCILAVPIGIGVLLCVDLGIRYSSYLLPMAHEKGLTAWEMLLREQRILYFNDFMPLFGAIIISGLFENEYRNNGWTNCLTRPVKRSSILFSKYITAYVYMVGMLIINLVVLLIVGKLFKFPEAIDFMMFGRMILIQMVSSAAIMVIHLYMTIENKNVIVSVGTAAVLSIVSSNLYHNAEGISKFNPYGFSLYSVFKNSGVDLGIYVISSIIFLVGFTITIGYFNKKKAY